MKINKGDTLFFKGKYGMYYEVVVLSVEGEHAMVQGNRWSFGKKKVRIEKLRKQPSKETSSFLFWCCMVAIKIELRKFW